MNVWNKNVVVAAGLGAALALGISTFALAHDDPIVPKPKDGPVTPVDPNRGLTDDQIRQRDRKTIEDQIKKDKAFADDWEQQAKDPRSLPRVHTISALEAMPATVGQAVGGAEIIVRAEVQKTRFDGESAVVDLKITEALKGSPGNTISLTQAGGPRFDEPSGQAILVEDPWDPILLKDDRVLLLLRLDPVNPGRYVTVATQTYRVEDGLVIVPEVSALTQFAGKPEADLVAAIRAELD